MIDTVTIEGFKNHLSTEIALGRFTLLVGPNAAGKSSALEAIHLMSRSVTESPGEILMGDTEFITLMDCEEAGFSLSIHGRDDHLPVEEGDGTPFDLKLDAVAFNSIPDEYEARRIDGVVLQ